MNTQILSKIEEPSLKKVPELSPGDFVRVHQKIREGGKERIQIFEGVVLKIRGGGLRASFLVRKVSFGIGIEKSFLLHSPNIAKIEIKKRAQVRRAYLSYLRNLQGKSTRLKDKQFDVLAVNVKDEPSIKEAGGDPSAVAQDDTGVSDAEVTEVSEEEVAELQVDEEPLLEIEKKEEKEAKKEEAQGQESVEESEQEAQKEELEEGVEKAEIDEEKGKSTEGETAEKTAEENMKPEEVAEEIKEETV